MDEARVLEAFSVLFMALERTKPNDRSSKDRAYAIVKTEVEKAFAYYHTFVVNETELPE